MIWTLKKCNEKMESPCLFTRQQALKLGYFHLLRVKNSNPLLTELSLCYLKHTKFYLEHKTSFIQISSIASFNSFSIAWLWGYCTFSDSSVVSLKSSPWPKYTKCETIFPKKSCSNIKLFVFLKITPIVFVVCTREQPLLFSVVLCVWYRQHRNSNLKRVH